MPSRGGVLSCDKLGFSYRPGTDLVLTDLSHVFEPQSTTAVTGASGRGKSTLLYLLGLMLTPSTGEVRWDGRNVSGLTDRERASLRATEIGFVFQDAVLDPARTVLDNVLEGALYGRVDRRSARLKALELLEWFGVAMRADHRPSEISGGQAQRIALCRALVKEPAVLLADEPSGNLDAHSAAVVWDAFDQVTESGTTVVIATHDLGRADRHDNRLHL